MSAFSIKACADDIGVHPSSIWKAVQTGVLPALRFGRVYRVEAKAWAEFKAKLNFTPLHQPMTLTRIDSKLIDRTKPTH